MKTFKILGLLLTYPNKDVQVHMGELVDVVRKEALLKGRVLQNLLDVMDDLQTEDLISLQETYVSLFDRGRGNCLHMFEHVHGESRDRGQAMIDLSDMYREKGLELEVAELPDYLPVFLEYLSRCPFDEAQALLGEAVHIIATIGTRLKVKGSPYHHIFEALQSLTDVKVDPRVIEAARQAQDCEDDSLEQLDREWEDTPAFDNTNTKSACQSCDLNPLAQTQGDELAQAISPSVQA